MNKKIKDGIDYISTNPKTLFAIDGAGALLSAFLLGIVLDRIALKGHATIAQGNALG